MNEDYEYNDVKQACKVILSLSKNDMTINENHKKR